jgi:hypothetical protein
VCEEGRWRKSNWGGGGGGGGEEIRLTYLLKC